MPQAQEPACTCCRERPRMPGQRWCRVCHAAYMRAWRKGRRPSDEARRRANARSYANQYKRRGKLPAQPCEFCGTTEGVEMHHDDYTKPLLVRWVCRPCKLIHRSDLADSRKT